MAARTPKPAAPARTKAKNADKVDLRVGVRIDDVVYVVDRDDLNALEWRAIKEATGLTPKHVILGLFELELEAVAAMVWIQRRRDEPQLAYNDVATHVTFGNLLTRDEIDELAAGEAHPPA